MSTFEVQARIIDDVIDHPKADRLSICRILGFEAITNKIEVDGVLTHRYQPGDLIIYVPEYAVIPEHLLRQYGYFDEAKGIGMLAGKAGNRVKAIKLRQVLSQGLVWPVRKDDAAQAYVTNESPDGTSTLYVNAGDDVAEFFGVTKYEPVIPDSMSGDVAGVPEMAFAYDIENWQNFPGFLDNDEVVAVEKCHGTNFRICYHPDVSNPELFGSRGSVGIASKSLGAAGKMFKRNRTNLGSFWEVTPQEAAEDRRLARIYWWQTRPGVTWLLKKLFGKRAKPPRSYNKTIVYVRVAIEQGLIEKVEALGRRLGKRVDLFGEVFGAGIQSLNYGQKGAAFRAFDIAIDRVMQDEADKERWFAELGVERLPVLYRGPWNEAELIRHRDGKTMIAGDNIREGIVVTAVGQQDSRETPDGRRKLRPFLKMVSPDYLKQEDGTEVQ